MPNSPTIGELLDRLTRSVQTRDWAEAEKAVTSLAARADEVAPDAGRHALDLLRGARRFRWEQTLAVALIRTGKADLGVRLAHVQALLSLGDVWAAQSLLEFLDRNLGPRGYSRAQLFGLLGQTFKQASLPPVDPDWAMASLKSAIDNYEQAINILASVADDPARVSSLMNGHWASIVSLRARAERKGLNLKKLSQESYDKTARGVVDRVRAADARGEATPTDFAAALEANVTLAEFDEAARWADRLARRGDEAGFEIGALIRELVDVCDLRQDSTGGRLVLPVLRAAILQRKGGQISLSGEEVATTVGAVDSPHYEKVFGAESYVTFQWYLTGVDRCRILARFETQTGGVIGSGLLVRGTTLHPGLGDRWLVLTNAHVLRKDDDASCPNALRSDEARVTFRAHPGSDQGPFRVGKVLWSSPPLGLDATLVEVERAPASIPDYAVWTHAPTLDPPCRIYAIGHPLGGDLSLSIHDNYLLDFLAPRIHYRTPTDHGSSGSPLFDDQWNLIGLHHAGDTHLRKLTGPGFYQANEGIWIQSIIEGLRNEWHS